MCGPQLLPLLGLGGGAAATAAGATAAGGMLAAMQGIGTAISIGGALFQGISGAHAANRQADYLAAQAKTEAQLTATEDQRKRTEFRQAIAQQRAELLGRGVQLDSVTATLLGQQAAAEMSFDSQSTRATGQARQAELSVSQQLAHADAMNSLLTGSFTAADKLVTGAPDIWPGLFNGGAK